MLHFKNIRKMFHMRKNTTCILKQIEFHFEVSKMNVLQHVLQLFVLNVEKKYWQVPDQCDL